MISGLTSITFRNKTIKEVAEIASKGGLSAIEWGSDVHCPPNDAEALKSARYETEKRGLSVSSYGTYMRLGVSENTQEEFEEICKAAQILGTFTVRIWAYTKNKEQASNDEYNKCVNDAILISDIAKKYGITVCFEYHRRTLTENINDALQLINDISRDNIRLYWQPNPDITDEENTEELKKVLPYAINIHCFRWIKGDGGKDVRMPLSHGTEIWKKYIAIAEEYGNIKHILMEFVKDGSDNQFLNDSDTLLSMINE